MIALGALNAHSASLRILDVAGHPTEESLDLDSREFFTGETWQELINNAQDKTLDVTRLSSKRKLDEDGEPIKPEQRLIVYVLSDKLHEFDKKQTINKLIVPTREKKRIARDQNKTINYKIVFPGPRMIKTTESRTPSPTPITPLLKKVPGEDRSIDINSERLGILNLSIADYFQETSLPKPLHLVEIKEDNHYFYFDGRKLQSWLHGQKNLHPNNFLKNPLTQRDLTKDNVKAYTLNSTNDELVNTSIKNALPILFPPIKLDYSDGKFDEAAIERLNNQSDEYLAEVVELYLDDNKLTDFPQILRRMPNLHRLELSGNSIGSFEHMPDLAKLRWLELNGNKISSFEHMPELANLRKLRLNGNKISSFEHMPELAKLERLYLSGNSISNEAIETWKQEHPTVLVTS